MYETCVPNVSTRNEQTFAPDSVGAGKAPVKEITAALRDVSMENLDMAVKLRSYFDMDIKMLPSDYPDRSDIRNDLIGDLIIQKDIRRILNDIFEILTGERPE